MDKFNLKLLLNFISICLIVMGIIGFSKAFYISSNTDKVVKSNIEYPLSFINGLVVDSNGNIYCSTLFYSRVQVYNQDGKYLYSLNINANSGDFAININSNNELLVATVRNNRLYTFKDGILLKDEENKNVYLELKKNIGKDFITQNTTYTVGNFSFLFPKIIKVQPKGTKTILISTSFCSWLFMAPLPALLFVLLGIILMLFTNYSNVKALFY